MRRQPRALQPTSRDAYLEHSETEARAHGCLMLPATLTLPLMSHALQGSGRSLALTTAFPVAR